jgi:hypothetical protein
MFSPLTLYLDNIPLIGGTRGNPKEKASNTKRVEARGS